MHKGERRSPMRCKQGRTDMLRETPSAGEQKKIPLKEWDFFASLTAIGCGSRI